ncbi:MAG: hypothetical protein PHI85_09375 [Victivallaceae bacterium]|nr:hypothetical protein [Victivallaceae bacterium]
MDYGYIFRREHPLCRRNRAVWERCRAAYSGGSEYIRQALVRHVSEIEIEFEERLARACYFNYPRKIARLITQFALSSPPERRGADRDIEEDFSRTGLRASEVMCQFSTLLNVYGTAFLAVEMPAFSGAVTLERREKEKLRPYARALSPLAVPDYAVGEDGRLLWAIVEENTLSSADPFLPPRELRRRRLWTRKDWQLFELESASGQVRLVAAADHKLGAVPIVRAQEPDGFGLAANHWFEDVVRISDAILNNESEAQMNIIKQMFGLLVISESFARRADNRKDERASGGEKFSHVLARSAALWESNDEKGVSRYIAPTGVETAQIREENAMLKREMFDVVGLAIQKENAVAQTAESKAWDYQNVRQFLACRVELLEQLETACWKMMRLYDPSLQVPEIAYNRDFAVVDLRGSIDGLLALGQLSDIPAYRGLVTRAAVGLLDKYQKIPPETRDAVIAELGKGGVNDATFRTE